MNVEPARAHKKEGKTENGRERGSKKREQLGKVGERGWLGAPAFQGSRGVAREAAAHLRVPTAPGERPGVPIVPDKAQTGILGVSELGCTGA